MGNRAVKVVLFCGGQGMRLRDYSETVPKPMVPIGDRPILWHLMKYYAHFGHTEFVLALGYRSEAIKEYFLNYKEWLTNDFVLADGGRQVRLLSSDIEDWTITFADTGSQATIGERLAAVQPYLEGESVFMANYADGLSDLSLPTYMEAFERSGRLASFMVVHSPQSFHVARVAADGLCTAIEPLSDADIWLNAGFFIFRREVFSYLRPGEELVVEPFRRLIAEEQLLAYRYEGFWQAMDTFKDRQALDDLHQFGDAPWQVWKQRADATSAAVEG